MSKNKTQPKSPFFFRWLKTHLEKKKQHFKFWQKYKDPGLGEYILYLSSPLRIFWTNFLAGLARGFGFILGATVVVAIALYIVGKVLVEVPLIGNFFEWLNKFLQENLSKYQIPRGGA